MRAYTREAKPAAVTATAQNKQNLVNGERMGAHLYAYFRPCGGAKVAPGKYAQGVSHSPESLSDDVVRTIDERANHCFGCGPQNPQGLHLHFTIDAADPEAISASATVELTRMHEGRPGYIHGGIIATLMDESMSKLNRPLEVIAMTRHMEIDYLRPAPLGTPLKLRSHHVRREGRKLFHAAELSGPDGRVLARAKGFFVVIDPAMLEKHYGDGGVGGGGEAML